MTSVQRRLIAPSIFALSKIRWLLAIHFKPRVVTHLAPLPPGFSQPRIKRRSPPLLLRFADSRTSSHQSAHLFFLSISSSHLYTFFWSHCDSYYMFNVPITILIIYLMYQKADCVRKSTTRSTPRKANGRNERHIYIISLSKSRILCLEIVIKSECTLNVTFIIHEWNITKKYHKYFIYKMSFYILRVKNIFVV